MTDRGTMRDHIEDLQTEVAELRRQLHIYHASNVKHQQVNINYFRALTWLWFRNPVFMDDVPEEARPGIVRMLEQNHAEQQTIYPHNHYQGD